VGKKALASQYRDGMLIRRASQSVSPLVLLRATLRLATKGISGIVVFFLAVLGCAFGGAMILTALIKPVLPGNTGTWVRNGHILSSGVLFPPPPLPAHEVLGISYIPIALVVGSLNYRPTVHDAVPRQPPMVFEAKLWQREE
jgi:hypothetical protein